MKNYLEMNDTTLISVIVPLYNKEQWVERCIRSIIDQTYKNIEILIINDGSTDKSRDVVASIDDLRIKIFNKKNGGVSSARNLGIEIAKGKYIAFIDADDEWNSRHLEVMIEGFQKFDDIVLVCDDYVEVCSDHIDNLSRRNLPFPIDTDEIQYHLIEDYLRTLKDSYFLLSGSSVLVKSSVIKKNKLQFPEQLIVGEDINYWLQLLQFGNFVFCDYLGLIYYRVDEQSAMKQSMKKVELVPLFFQGIDVEAYNDKDKKNIKKFLTQEYYKKAYQNRGLSFRDEELSTSIGGGVQIGRTNVLVYLAIRYCPQFIFSLYKSYKKEKI